MKIRVIEFGSPEYSQEVSLREKVLREPLGLRFSSEELNRESSEIHIAAFDENIIKGCLLLRPDKDKHMKMRQVAVSPDRQGAGIGKLLVHFAEEWAKENGIVEFELNARETAVAFYLSLGYELVGEPFIDLGIPHRKMRKSIAKPAHFSPGY